MKTSYCSCGRLAAETITLPIRIMAEHRDEMRKFGVCAKCAQAFREGPDFGSANVAPAEADEETFTIARANFERNTRDFVAALDRWREADREDSVALSSAAGWITTISRNLAGYAGDMATALHHIENRAR
jgi:hypothetical protein